MPEKLLMTLQIALNKPKKIYLETHTNLDAAIHMYEKCGYTEIEKPESVVHSTMNRFYIKDL